MKLVYLLLLTLFSLPLFLSAQQEANPEENNPLSTPHLPDLFGYQDYDTRMLKISLLDLIQFKTPEGLVGRIQVAYEHKLTPVYSLNTELSANYFFHTMQPGSQNMVLQGGSLSLQIEPRYYLDLKRRIFFKQSKNNFSANYVSLAFSTRLFQLKRGLSATDNGRYLYSDNFGVAPLFGVQRRILKWILLDFNLGFRVSYGDPIYTRLFFPKDSKRAWQISPHTTLRLGIAI